MIRKMMMTIPTMMIRTMTMTTMMMTRRMSSRKKTRKQRIMNRQIRKALIQIRKKVWMLLLQFSWILDSAFSMCYIL